MKMETKEIRCIICGEHGNEITCKDYNQIKGHNRAKETFKEKLRNFRKILNERTKDTDLIDLDYDFLKIFKGYLDEAEEIFKNDKKDN